MLDEEFMESYRELKNTVAAHDKTLYGDKDNQEMGLVRRSRYSFRMDIFIIVLLLMLLFGLDAEVAKEFLLGLLP